LNGGIRVFIGRYQNAVSSLTWIWSANFVPSSLSRSAGGWSASQSACPFCTAVISDSTVWPNDSTMVSG